LNLDRPIWTFQIIRAFGSSKDFSSSAKKENQSMPTNLPYLTNAASLDNAFNKVKSAATPPNFNNDFVQTKLQIKGGSGSALPPFFKKIGFVSSDGSPTELYHQFRNSSSSGAAVAEAIRIGYRALYEVNEYAHELSDAELKGLILQVTGLEDGNRAAQAMVTTFVRLKKHADFEASLDKAVDIQSAVPEIKAGGTGARAGAGIGGLTIGYTINLNLPPSTNIEVFNAIFKSLKENLLSEK
jgi:hypothetical protein